MTLCGILNVDKPADWTSREVVDRVERHLRAAAGRGRSARAGHAGTLDPLATGVLVVCVGQATRLIQYVQRMPKQYRATFQLGQRSETHDIDSEVFSVADAPLPTRAAVDAALPRFVGEILQRPPEHSAIKVAGRRAYELARRGQPVELAPRTVAVHSLAVLRYDYPELELDIACGSGMYVRALGRDLAESLGTAAVMSALERTAVGGFRVEEALTLDELNDETLVERLQPPLAAVAELPCVELSDEQLAEIRFGRAIEAPSAVSEGAAKPQAATEAESTGTEWAAVDSRGDLAAILFEKYPGQLWPARNFLPAEPDT